MMKKAENLEIQQNTGYESSALMNLSNGQQAGIVAVFIGTPALAAMNVIIGFAELAIVATIVEGASATIIFFIVKFILARRGIDLGETIKEKLRTANWAALLPEVLQTEVLAVEGSIEPHNVQEVVSDLQEAVLPVEPVQESQSVLETQDEDSMFISRTLYPHANAVFSNRVAILGIPGAGKSNTVAVFAEELGKFGAPLVIFDTENEYKPLCAQPYFHRPFVADYSNVSLEVAFSFGQRIMDERLQVVLNLDSYDDDDLAAKIMIDIIKGIQHWEESLANDDRIPCAIILDEAAVWLPQNGKESMLSKQKDENGYTTLDKLQKIFFSVVVRRGRKRGIGFILASQRSAEIDKRAIASAQWKFLHLQNQPNDLEVYKEFGVDGKTAQALGRGEAFVIGPDVKGVHQIRKRNSPDNAKTPGLESLRKRRYTESLAGRASQMVLPTIPVTEPVKTVESRPIEQSHMSRYSSPKLNPTLERALKLYNGGCTSYRDLGKAMNVGKDTAGAYIQQLKARKLV